MSQGFVNQQQNYTIQGVGSPTVIPQFVGQQYIDISIGAIYIATGTIGIYNWGYVGSGNVSNDYLVGLTSWYDASDSITPITNGSTLTGWNDKGSQLNHLVNVEGTPQYMTNIQNGLPAAYFSGAQSIYGSNKADVSQPQTHFLVFKPTGWSTGIYQGIITMLANNTIFKNTGATTIGIAAGSNVIGQSISNNTCNIASVVFNGASSSITINNNSTVVGNAGTNSNTNLPYIGRDNSYYYIGYVMEWRVYDEVC